MARGVLQHALPSSEKAGSCSIWETNPELGVREGDTAASCTGRQWVRTPGPGTPHLMPWMLLEHRGPSRKETGCQHVPGWCQLLSLLLSNTEKCHSSPGMY